jgi:transglutaminase-like putative cysteine protease
MLPLTQSHDTPCAKTNPNLRKNDSKLTWVSLDVTHRCLSDERHIRLAAATDYTACLPIKGLRRGGGDEHMAVDIRIEPVNPD